MMDSDDIDDVVDEIDLQASDDVRFPRTKDVRFVNFCVSSAFLPLLENPLEFFPCLFPSLL